MDITDKVMLINLSISTFTGEKIDKKVSQEVADHHGADAHDSGRYAKQIISKHALEPTRAAAGAARAAHYEATLPWSDVGGRILSVAGYFGYMEKMRALKRTFDESIEVFIQAYPTLIDQARSRLNGMFDESNYPDITTIRGRFTFEVNASPLPSGKNWFLQMADNEMEALRQHAEVRLNVNIEEAVRDTYRRVADVTAKMVEKLSDYGVDATTGKATGIFRDSLITNVRDLADILPSLNITGSTELAALTDDLRNQLCKFDAGALRADPKFRELTLESAKSIYDRAAEFLA